MPGLHEQAPEAKNCTITDVTINTESLPDISRNPQGQRIAVGDMCLLRNGRAWLPVMGEFHFSRYPAELWRDELLKMKAGGIDIVATYVFWIHHEEIEGLFDWTGQRNLGEFVRCCARSDLLVMVRCGPWCHGEVRNGGFPDWLLPLGDKLRSDHPQYLAAVRRLYEQIADQLKGLLWKDGGPVIGIQLENEYGGPAEHLLNLKRLAQQAGLDVPLYTRTGWPKLKTSMPFGQILPLFGAYAEGFWDRTLVPMPADYRKAFVFQPVRGQQAIGADQSAPAHDSDDAEQQRYPYLTCELGGGMMCSYHRRIRIDPRDALAIALVKLGSGCNMLGYYMYHGGTNPPGKLTTLNESQASGYPNDLPVKSYDFQAPLGQYGQIRPHYHLLRRLHLFVHDFGQEMASWPARFPAGSHLPRWCYRSNGQAGFVFVNNYQRLSPMPAIPDVQFELLLDHGRLLLPDRPVTIPADCSFIWPFNLQLGGAKLIYATAQPLCRVDNTYVFAQVAGVPVEFAFDTADLTVNFALGRKITKNGRVFLTDVPPGNDAVIKLCTNQGPVSIFLLDEKTSLECWKGRFAGRERIVLSPHCVIFDNDRLRIRRLSQPEPLVFQQIQTAGPPRQICIGAGGVAEAPSDEDFNYAAVWQVSMPGGLEANGDVLLRLRYAGDVARVYLDDELITDDFYNGNPLEVGLQATDIRNRRLFVKILPLRKNAPIYLAPDAWPGCDSAAMLYSVEMIRQEEQIFTEPTEAAGLFLPGS